MIESALLAYLRSNLSVSRVYVVESPPSPTLPCVVLDNNGDDVDRYYGAGGAITSGVHTLDMEATVWAGKNTLSATNLARELIALLDNFSGSLTDTSLSPPVVHRVRTIRAEDGGMGFDGATEHHSHAVFLEIVYS